MKRTGKNIRVRVLKINMIELTIFVIFFVFICGFAYRLLKTSEDDCFKFEVLVMLGVMVIAITPLTTLGIGILLI